MARVKQEKPSVFMIKDEKGEVRYYMNIPIPGGRTQYRITKEEYDKAERWGIEKK